MAEILHDLPINADLEMVFNAISIPHQLENWWPRHCQGETHVGGTYHFYFTDEYDWYGKVTEWNPNKSFEITMTIADHDWLDTAFGFTLSPANGGTRLTFYHKNWKEANSHFRHTSFCWAMLLKGLKDYLEQGKVIPFELRS
ncbi:MAG: SRPBCC domain-containing protein [Flavobacteriales bacterium]|nr:SRPBCC domain-containing protein [Flavobacteriales bacterium]